MASYKTEVIETLFRERFDPNTGKIAKPLVTITEIGNAIRSYNAKHHTKFSDANPANFAKDIFRTRNGANRNWPKFVFDAGFSGRQVTGGGSVFEFVPINSGQTEPFPPAEFALPSAETPIFRIESVSLPLASRVLGRSDEPWMLQVIARLRIVETHFSLASSRAIRQIDLLQLNVKLNKTEIDALFLAHEETKPNVFEQVIITCEAKSAREDIIESQILNQAKAPFGMPKIVQDRVIPIAIKCIPPSTLFVAEFETLERSSYQEVESLIIASQSLFEITPPVPGICR